MDIFFNLFGIRSIVFWDYSQVERKFYETVKGKQKWPAKWIHLASLFILVSSMFAMPVGILAETTTDRLF